MSVVRKGEPEEVQQGDSLGDRVLIYTVVFIEVCVFSSLYHFLSQFWSS